MKTPKTSKKSIRTPKKNPRQAADIAREKEFKQLTKLLKQKFSSPVFDGGFDSLIQKMTSMENSQRAVVEKINEFDRILHDPDRGVFSRIKSVENEQGEENKVFKRRIGHLEERADGLERWRDELESDHGALANAKSDHNLAENVRAWSGKIAWSVLVGIISTIGLLLKTLWEILTSYKR